MDKFITRFTIFYCTIYFGYVLYYAWDGVNVFDDSYKLLLEYALYLLAREHPKYNCKFARFLALNLLFTDGLTYIDTTFGLFEDAEVFLYIVSGSWILTTVITIYLAIKHFIRSRKVTKRRYKEYGIRFRE